MKEFTVGGWRVEIDPEATRAWYEAAEEWPCDCGHCRNFLEQTETALPEELRALLEGAGADLKKPGCLCQLYQEGEEHVYEVQYPLVGRVLERGGGEETNLRFLLPEEHVEPDEAVDFPAPRIDLAVERLLPWVLPEPASGPHNILFSSELEEDTADIEALLKKVIPAALDAEGVGTPCEVDVLLTDDAGIHAINLEMREVDRPTDVLSFPMFEYLPGQPPQDDTDADPETGLTPLGDMVLSLERARAQAAEYGHSTERELSYLAVHSLLHLLGYDHLDEGPQKRQMRAREEAILEALGITRER